MNVSDQSPVSASTALPLLRGLALSLLLALIPTTAFAATLSSVTLSASSVTGGASVKGSVNLDSLATTDMDFKLSSNNAAAVLPVATVRVPRGAASATFAVNTVPVPTDASATITVVSSVAKKTASLKILAPVPTTVTLSPTSLIGSQSFKATVSLSGPAPSGGMMLSVATSDSTKATIDSAANFAAGQQSVQIGGQSSAVTAAASVVLKAVDPSGRSASATLSLMPLKVQSLALSSPKVTGGTGASCTATLNATAPSGGFTATIASSNPGVASAPASVTFAAGQSTAKFDIATTNVAADTAVTIKVASPDGTTVSTSLGVTPLKVQSLALSSPKVTGGTGASCTATLNAPAPSGGFTATVASSNPGVASAPVSLTFAAGQTSAKFDITTTSVAADTAVTINVTSPGGTTVGTSLTVAPLPPPALVSITASSTVFGGNRVDFSLSFDRPLPASTTVQFTSSNPTVVPINPNVGFQMSGQTTVPFSVFTPLVNTDTPVTVTATSGGATKSVSFTVKALTLLLAIPATTVSGGTPLKGTLSLSGPREVDTVVALSSNSGAVSIPTSVTLPARSAAANPASVEFDVFTQSVASPATVAMTAQAQGFASKSVSLTITPVTLASVTLSATGCDLSKNCTSNYTGTVTLSGPAPTNGLTLSLSSDRPGSLVPQQTLLISSGQTTGTITLSLGTSPTSGPVTITAAIGSGSQKRATFDIVKTFINVETLTLASAQGLGGVPVSGTVNVRQFVASGSNVTPAPATEFDVAVALSGSTSGGSSAGTFQPASVTIPRGQSSANFTYSPPSVTTDTPLELRASVSTQGITGGTVKSAAFTATAPVVQSISLSRTSAQGGEQLSGTVQLSGPITFSNSVTVTSSDGAAATITGPSFTTGATSATFQVNTSPNVAAPTPVTITATLGSSTQSTSLTVERASRLARIELPAARIFGGVPTTVTVTLDGPAPSGGASVSLTDPLRLFRFDSNPATVPAGQSSLVVNATPATVGNPTQISVIGSFKNESKSVSVSVEPLFIDPCQSAPSSVAGGTSMPCTLSISTQGMVAPRGGIQFNVRSSNPAVLSAPATVTIPEGQTSTSVQITTQPVTANTSVNLTFEKPNNGFTKSFTVTP